MIMKFKKIYIEITNKCNLNCSFCSKDKRELKSISVKDFEKIMIKINNYTDFICLHIKGEPLLHKDLDKILYITQKYNKKVIITTNGTLLKDKLAILLKYNNIYQINISLHSENNKNNYLENIFFSINILKEKCFISLRFWTLNENRMDKKTLNFINLIKEKYNILDIYNGIKIDKNIFISLDNIFEWPNEKINLSDGFCYGGKSHIGILCDGSVVICCLDSNNLSNLGNIYNSSLNEILKSEKYLKTIEYFKNNKCYLDVCKHCSFKNRFK